MSKYNHIDILDFCKDVKDGTHDSPKKTDRGFPLITSKHLKNGQILLDQAYFISHEDYEKVNKRSKVDKWDILMSMIGTVGEACIVKNTPEFAIKNMALFKSRDEISAKWLYYYLVSESGQQQISQKMSGTSQKFISLGDLRNLTIPKPSESFMRKAVTLLSYYDDYIEINSKRVETLEQIAQLIYREWFVHFRFPGHEDVEMVDSEIGLIPEGWSIERMGEYIRFHKGKKANHYCSENEQGAFKYLLIDSIKNGCGQYICDKNMVLVNEDQSIMIMDGASSGKVFIGNHGAVGSTLAKIETFEEICDYYIYSFCKENEKIITDNNTGTAIPHANKDFINNMKFPLPPRSLMTEFKNLVDPLFKSIINTKKMTKICNGIREILLPRLISGELDVSDLDIEIPEEVMP